jgi:hypothetical protein
MFLGKEHPKMVDLKSKGGCKWSLMGVTRLKVEGQSCNHHKQSKYCLNNEKWLTTKS